MAEVKPISTTPPAVTPEDRRHMIEEAAYYRALQRQLEGGDPVADWIEAEREIAERLAKAGIPQKAGEIRSEKKAA